MKQQTVTKTLYCTECGEKIKITGQPKEEISFTCPTCSKPGTFVVSKHKDFKKDMTRYFKSLSRKQLIGYSIAGILIVVFLGGVIIPSIRGDLHYLTVLSGSMEPNIHVGDIVVSAKVDPDDIKIDDVITFHYNNDPEKDRFITHRVINISEREYGIRFITKGDANEEGDVRPVLPSEVIGRVAVVLPYMGYAVNFASSKEGFVILIVIPACLIILNEARKIIRLKSKEKPTVKKEKKKRKIK